MVFASVLASSLARGPTSSCMLSSGFLDLPSRIHARICSTLMLLACLSQDFCRYTYLLLDSLLDDILSYDVANSLVRMFVCISGMARAPFNCSCQMRHHYIDLVRYRLEPVLSRPSQTHSVVPGKVYGPSRASSIIQAPISFCKS